MKALLDINVFLDVFLARDPWLADSAAVVQAGARREGHGLPLRRIAARHILERFSLGWRTVPRTGPRPRLAWGFRARRVGRVPVPFYCALNPSVRRLPRTPQRRSRQGPYGGQGVSRYLFHPTGGPFHPGIGDDLPRPRFRGQSTDRLAVEARLDAIVTRNPRDFAGSPVPVLSPAELMARLPKAPEP